MIVADASVLVDLLIDRPAALRLIEDAFTSDGTDTLHAPELIRIESAQALRLLVRSQQITNYQAAIALERMSSGRLVDYSAIPLMERIWELRHNLTAYDASYLALAERIDDSLLLTGDGGLADEARKSLGTDRVWLMSAATSAE